MNIQSKLTYFFIAIAIVAISFGLNWMITDPAWTYEAVGGYFGGVLGGLSVLILVTSSYFQQKRDQEDDVMRRYELLYDDITGCSAQLFNRMIEEKMLKGRKLQKGGRIYEAKKKQFENGDRGVYLRFLKDEEKKLKEIVKEKTKVSKSIDRYLKMCDLIFVGNSDIVKALEKTDIGIVYKILYDKNKTETPEKGQKS